MVEGEEVPEGVPEMTPVALLRVKPAGSVGDTEYETGVPVERMGEQLLMG